MFEGLGRGGGSKSHSIISIYATFWHQNHNWLSFKKVEKQCSIIDVGSKSLLIISICGIWNQNHAFKNAPSSILITLDYQHLWHLCQNSRKTCSIIDIICAFYLGDEGWVLGICGTPVIKITFEYWQKNGENAWYHARCERKSTLRGRGHCGTLKDKNHIWITAKKVGGNARYNRRIFLNITGALWGK